MKDRRYAMSATERDERIVQLRKLGWPYHKIGKVVGMSTSGVCQALERIAQGRPGMDSRY